jgi:quercetin dioxygenase-like cupin family protein
MNLKDSFADNKLLQTKKIFTSSEGVVSIQIKTGGQLKEHLTTVPAFLVCVIGEIVFENVKGAKEVLFSGDYVNIEPNVKHWIVAEKDSNLLLIK